jgi:hypothetical protein
MTSDTECQAAFEGLTCALLTDHETPWHWDPRGIDWKKNPGFTVLVGVTAG